MLGEIPEVYIYLNDILIFTKNIEENLQTLAIVLEKLVEAGITLNSPKCEFLCRKVEYLSFLVSKEGYKSDSKKIQIILELAKPETIKQMHSFIRIANFHSRHVLQLSTFLALLNNILKSKKKEKII